MLQNLGLLANFVALRSCMCSSSAAGLKNSCTSGFEAPLLSRPISLIPSLLSLVRPDLAFVFSFSKYVIASKLCFFLDRCMHMRALAMLVIHPLELLHDMVMVPDFHDLELGL
ncbi:hypothetical protein F4811DRAFT_521837 [Daldinia bambusicola]|nr:hypothetical protein F4811DRAFT_521837 [Daldinia bambusicola]